MANYDDVVTESDIPKSILKNPMDYITKWGSGRFKKMEDVFRYLALMPSSLIAPSFPYRDSYRTTNLHLLLLTPPGGAKTMISQSFSEFTLNPFNFESITSASMEDELSKRNHLDVSLITGDICRLVRDRVLIKTLEGVTDDTQRISRFTARKTRDFKINAVFFGAGVPSDISHFLQGGFLSRTIPLIIKHSKEAQDEIGKEILNSIRYSMEIENSESIKKYYKLLWNIQVGNSKDYRPIDRYLIADMGESDKFFDAIYNLWVDRRNLMSKKIVGKNYWFREMINGIKVLYSSAFLNRFNRKIEEEKNISYIVPNNDDLKLALELSDREIQTKNDIGEWLEFVEKKKIDIIEKVINSDELSQTTRSIIKSISEMKRD